MDTNTFLFESSFEAEVDSNSFSPEADRRLKTAYVDIIRSNLTMHVSWGSKAKIRVVVCSNVLIFANKSGSKSILSPTQKRKGKDLLKGQVDLKLFLHKVTSSAWLLSKANVQLGLG